MHPKAPTWMLVTDASPKGLGAVLARVTQGAGGPSLKPMEAFEAIIRPEDAALLQVEYGEASSQGVLESYTLLRAVQRWSAHLSHCSILIRSDSTVALGMARKLGSGHPTVNLIAGELSLCLDRYRIPAVTCQHLVGRLNKEADWLSRIHDRAKDPPVGLRDVPIRRIAAIKPGDWSLSPAGAGRPRCEEHWPAPGCRLRSHLKKGASVPVSRPPFFRVG